VGDVPNTSCPFERTTFTWQQSLLQLLQVRPP
jgi:hypothetical protein